MKREGVGGALVRVYDFRVQSETSRSPHSLDDKCR